MTAHPTTARYDLRSLAPADVEALVAWLGLPTPTPDVPLSAILTSAGLTPDAVYARLESATSIRLMIAAAALRGSVTRLPPDPRLDPLPHRPAPVARPRTPAEAARSPHRPTPPPARPTGGRRLTWVAEENPKRPGSAARARFDLYRVGATADELLAAGLTTADFSWDTSRGFVRWEDE